MKDWKQIKELFQKVIELQSDQRKEFLDQECGDNSALRKEIESLIESFNKSHEFLESPHLKTYELIAQKNLSYSLLGKRIGNYQIEKKIGDGGMAVIYSALRVDDQFKKQVAIKFIKKGMDTDEIIRRFKIEQQALAGLEHPNIARIIDAGTTESGLSYFVMELIDGVPIDEYCNYNKLSIVERLKLFQKVCSAVQYAHRNLIVHRDIKMNNIFVTKDGAPKLLDFGIAKILSASNEQTSFTRTGMKLMTLEYASPEQFKGKQITTATDIYSLGVVLYELLTGHRPFKFKNSLPSEIENIICNSDPKKPSSIINEVEEINPSNGTKYTISPDSISNNRNENFDKIKKRLSGDIDNIILKAMRKEPERRYSSVEQFSEDIQRYLTGMPVIAHKDSTIYRFKKFFKRNRLGVATGIIILLILCAGAAGIIYNANSAKKERDKAQIEAAKVVKINSLLQQIFSSADPSKEGKDVRVVDVLENAVKRIDYELKDQPEIQAALRTTIGITFQNLGFYNRAVTQLKEAMQTNKLIFGEINDKTAASIKNLALAFHYQGKFNIADSLYKESINIQRKLNKHNKAFADALNDYGTLRMDLGYYDSAIKHFEEALDIYKEIKDTSNIISVFNNMGLSFDYKRDLDGAEKLYKKALQMTMNLSGNNELQLVHLYNNLAFIYQAKNNFHGAMEMFKKSYEIRKKTLGENHPEFALAAYNLGCEYYYNNNYEKSQRLINKAKNVWEKTLPNNHPYFGKIFYWLGKLSNKNGKPKKAENYLLKSLRIRLNGPANNYTLALTKCELGRAYMLQKKYEKAELIILKNFEVLKDQSDENNKDTELVTKLLHELYTRWNKPEEAEKYLSASMSR